MLNRLFQAAVITFLLGLTTMGGNLLKVSHAQITVEDSTTLNVP